MIISGKIRLTIIAFCAFLLGGLFVWFLYGKLPFLQPEQVFRGNILRLENSGYRFIDPLLACDTGSEEAFPEFKPIKDKLSDLIKKQINDGTANDISVYVRSLKAGRWFGINSDTTYAPASLLKVFIMMAYYKEAEDNSAILQKQIIFKSSANSESNTPGEAIPHLTNGRNYTIDQLINQMIIYSDNDALSNILDNSDVKIFDFLKDICFDLNIPSPLTVDENQFDFMPVTSYSMIFRVLFSATYLNRSDSEKALELLSKTDYKDGIVEGVPENIVVSHKFGIKKATTPQLHDCGIVYYPSHPYLLCIMTAGSDFSLLQKDIQDISRLTYQEIDNYFSKK